MCNGAGGKLYDIETMLNSCKIPGTKLSIINIKYSTIEIPFSDFFCYENFNDYVSYGTIIINDTEFLKIDLENYVGNNYYLIEILKYKEYLELNNLKTKKMLIRKITGIQGKQIIDAACDSWKPILAERWGKQIVLNDNIEINEDYYQLMRKACTILQNKLFDEIFGSDFKFKIGDWVRWEGTYPVTGKICTYCEKKSFESKNEYWGLDINGDLDSYAVCSELKLRLATLEEVKIAITPIIDYDKLKTGSVVKIKKTDNFCFGTFSDNDEVTIVLYKTKEYITNNGIFLNSGCYSLYITFYDKNKYILFKATDEIDYITEVIKY